MITAFPYKITHRTRVGQFGDIYNPVIVLYLLFIDIGKTLQSIVY